LGRPENLANQAQFKIANYCAQNGLARIKNGAPAMSAISIIVPSLLNKKHLQTLFTSLDIQNFYEKFEVLICYTKSDTDMEKWWPEDLYRFSIRLLSTPKANIAAARNVGIKNARGSLILFLDEDCSLPDSSFLERLYSFHKKNPNFGGGGYYIDKKTNSKTPDRFYNLLCNSWVANHIDQSSQCRVLLGGCCFYPRQILIDNQIYFDELCSRAGEEYPFNSLYRQLGHPLILSQDWNVYHSPQNSFFQVMKKSWIQGKARASSPLVIKKIKWTKVFKYLLENHPNPLSGASFLTLYFLVGRISAMKQKSLARFPLSNPTHKKSALKPSV
jgi:glycosyltransferase involved in cell wall biosynthesis